LSVSKYSIINFIASIAVLAIGFMVSIPIGRILGPSGEGQLKLVFNAAMYLTLFGNMGLSNAQVYFYGKDRKNLPAIVGNLIVFLIVMSFILCAVYFVLPDGIFSNTSDTVQTYAVLLVPFMLMFTLVLGVYQAKSLFIHYNIFLVARPLSYLLTICFLIIFDRFTVLNTLFALVASFAFVNLLQTLFSYKLETGQVAFSSNLLTKSLVFGIKGQLANVLQFFNYRLDFFIIAYLLDDAQVGMYSIATIFAEVLLTIPRAISTVLLPRIAGNKSENEIRELTEISCRTALFLSLIAGMILLMAGNMIPMIYSDKFIGSVKPLMYLVPGVIILGIANILGANLIGRGFPILTSYCTGAGLIVTVVLDILLIPEYGIIGAAIASSCSYAVTSITCVILYKRKTLFSFKNMFIIKNRDFKFLHNKIKVLLNRN